MEERKEIAVRGTQSYIDDVDIAQVKSTMDKIRQFQHVVMSTSRRGRTTGECKTSPSQSCSRAGQRS